MYKHSHILISLFILLLSSCGGINNGKNSDIVKEISIQKIKSETINFLPQEDILKEALNISIGHIEENSFYKEYNRVSEDGLNVKVQIDLGHHFSEVSPHLIIRRSDLSNIYIDIYSKFENNFKKKLSHEESHLTYMNDTIQDINGDGYKDFVINGYGSSGCCLKAYSLVYLFRPDSLSFSKDYYFLNPTFSPKEKTVRGICYGYPCETEMYKYKWNGEKIDTIQYVSYEKDKEDQKTGFVIISNTSPYDKGYKIIKRLKSVPAEYHSISGYDWFTGDIYK